MHYAFQKNKSLAFLRGYYVDGLVSTGNKKFPYTILKRFSSNKKILLHFLFTFFLKKN